MKQVALGIDIGGTNVAMGLVDKAGLVVEKYNFATTQYDTPEKLVLDVFNYWTSFCKNNDYEIIGIGIGAPNGNYYKGTIEFAPNLHWKGVVPLAALFETQFKLKAILTNDANAAAMGEMLFGAAKSMKHFIMITLGTGLGSGIVIDGNLLYGHDGFAGELGHVIVENDGRLCGCGRNGCLETYASATGIVRTANEFLPKFENSILNKSTITAKSIYDAALQGDALALKLFEFTGNILGKALANAIAFSSPEAIILFGGLANAGHFIVEPTEKSMQQNCLEIFKNKVKLIVSEIPEGDAAILGAASLIWQNDI